MRPWLEGSEFKAGLGLDKSLPEPFAAIRQHRPEEASFTLECVEPELALVQSLLPLHRWFPSLRSQALMLRNQERCPHCETSNGQNLEQNIALHRGSIGLRPEGFSDRFEALKPCDSSESPTFSRTKTWMGLPWKGIGIVPSQLPTSHHSNDLTLARGSGLFINFNWHRGDV